MKKKKLKKRLMYADAVAIVWTHGAIGWGDMKIEGRTCAHTLGCVRAALAGETDPAELGCDPQELNAALAYVQRHPSFK